MKKTLVVLSVMVLICCIVQSSNATVIFDPVGFNPDEPYETFEGRFFFLDDIYFRWMIEGEDEIGLFLTENDVCFASTNEKREGWYSYYDGLDINTNYVEGMLNQTLDFYILAYNSDELSSGGIYKGIWEAKILEGPYYDDGYGYMMDIKAYQLIPEPATLLFLGLGGSILFRKKR